MQLSTMQAVVRSNTVETKQEAQWTIIPEPAAPSQKEHPSEQEVQERYASLSHFITHWCCF